MNTKLPKKLKKIAIILACQILIFPEGIGLFFLIGCRESLGESTISFIKYVADAIRENARKPVNSLLIFEISIISPRINAGANRAKFLSHCLGLEVLITWYIKLIIL